MGRDPATLTITVGVTVRYPSAMAGDAPAPTSPGLSGTTDDIAAGLRAHEAAGAEHVIAVTRAVHARDGRGLRRGGRAVPRGLSR